MLTIGPNLGLLDNGDYGEGSYHETLHLYRALDLLVQPHVLSSAISSPPADPAEGDAYIVPVGATGTWAGKENQIARWTERSAAVTPQWEFFTPKENWVFGVDDADTHLKFDGTDWVPFAAGGGGGYVLPMASGATLGGIKVGANLQISGSGVLTVQAGAFETAGAMATHVAAGDPHPQYLTAAEGNATYEAAGAVADHAAAGNPHPQYLTTAEGDAAYEAAGAVTAHAAAGDPHPQYLTQAEADTLYKTIAYNYTLPAASVATLGGIKVGSGLSVDVGGVLSVTPGGHTGDKGVCIFKCGGVNMAQNATRYAGALGTSFASTESTAQYLFSETTVVKRLFARVNAAVAASNSFTITVRKNGVDTALSCVIGAGTTDASDIANSVTFGPGDLMSVKVVASATTGSTSELAIAMLLNDSTDSFGRGVTLLASATSASTARAIGEGPGTQAAENNLQVALPAIYAGNYPAVVTTKGDMVLNKNGALAYPASWNGTSRGRSLFAAGDLFSFFDQDAATASAGTAKAQIDWSPVVSTDYPPCPILFSRTSHAQATTGYMGGYGLGTGSLVESEVQIPIPRACTMKTLHISSDATPAAGQTVTVTVRKNGVDTSLTCQLTNAGGRVASDTVDTVAFAAGDLLSISVTSSATVGTRHINASILAFE